MPSPDPPVLSVLDLAPVGAGSDPSAALAGSVDLARLAERRGYARVWVAEHHNMPGIASSSPPVLIAHLAAATESIRVGAGGVMLPNHSSLVVAEQFGMLEALHPGRIDLGLGRAPGTDPYTAAALRRAPMTGADDFPEQLRDLFAYFEGTHPRIAAVPGRGYRPAVWMLGSSDYSAQVAGVLGLPFSFAYHFSAANLDVAVAAYRARFQPSDDLDRPYLSLGVPVVCAETTERARWLARPSALSFLRLRQGRPGPLPTPEEAAAAEFSPEEEQFMAARSMPVIAGTPDEVRDELEALAARTGADELMLTTMVHGVEDRLRSYDLVADVFDMPSADAAGSPSAAGSVRR